MHAVYSYEVASCRTEEVVDNTEVADVSEGCSPPVSEFGADRQRSVGVPETIAHLFSLNYRLC
jgi:hypothetical protein